MATRRLTRDQMVIGLNAIMEAMISGQFPRQSTAEVEHAFREQKEAGQTPIYGQDMADSIIEYYDKSK